MPGCGPRFAINSVAVPARCVRIVVASTFRDCNANRAADRISDFVGIGILDEDGEVLLETLVWPERHQSLLDAQRVHGVSFALLGSMRAVRRDPVAVSTRSCRAPRHRF